MNEPSIVNSTILAEKDVVLEDIAFDVVIDVGKVSEEVDHLKMIVLVVVYKGVDKSIRVFIYHICIFDNFKIVVEEIFFEIKEDTSSINVNKNFHILLIVLIGIQV